MLSFLLASFVCAALLVCACALAGLSDAQDMISTGSLVPVDGFDSALTASMPND